MHDTLERRGGPGLLKVFVEFHLKQDPPSFKQIMWLLFGEQNGKEMPTLKDINEAITQQVTYSRVKLQRWKAQAVQKPNWSRLMEYF